MHPNWRSFRRPRHQRAHFRARTPRLAQFIPTGPFSGWHFAGRRWCDDPTATNWSLDDIFFDVGAWLAEEAAQQFALLEGEAVIRGDGSNKPTGMLHTVPTSRDDWDSPLRDKAVYQFINDGDSPFALDADTLISLVYKVAAQYRQGASFVMNSQTAAAVMKLKDLEGRHLWVQSIAQGQPPLLLGYPVALWEQMDDLDASGGGNATFPIAFGNFQRGYLLVDRVGMRIVVDPYSTPGFTRF